MTRVLSLCVSSSGPQPYCYGLQIVSTLKFWQSFIVTPCLVTASPTPYFKNNQTIDSLSSELEILSRRADDTTPLRVLAIGASIVWGYASSDGNGFRYPLRNALVQGGRNVNVRRRPNTTILHVAMDSSDPFKTLQPALFLTFIRLNIQR